MVKVNNTQNITLLSEPAKIKASEYVLNAVFENDKAEPTLDLFEKTVVKKETENKKNVNKKEYQKKILTGVGIGLAVIALIGLGIICKKRINTAKVYAETKKFYDFDNFKKIPMFKDMNEEEIQDLLETLKLDKHFLNVFTGVSTGIKPAGWIDVPIALEKCQFHSKIDACVASWGGTFMFNQEKSMEVIAKHKNIFTERLELPKNASVKEIYERILDTCGREPGKYKLSEIYTQKEDLMAILCGYSKRNAMIYELESTLHGFQSVYNPAVEELRRHPKELSKKLLEVLHSPKSPYKNLDKKELEELEEAIKKLRNPYKVKHSNIPFIDSLFGHIRYADDPEEFKRIEKAAQKYANDFRIEHYQKLEQVYPLQSYRNYKTGQWKDYYD